MTEAVQAFRKELAPVHALAARAYNATNIPGQVLAPVPITVGDAAGTVPKNLPKRAFDAGLAAHGVPADANDMPRQRLAAVLNVRYMGFI